MEAIALANLLLRIVIAVSICYIATIFGYIQDCLLRDVRDYLHGIYRSINRHEEQINKLEDIAYQLERIAHVEEMEQ